MNLFIINALYGYYDKIIVSPYYLVVFCLCISLMFITDIIILLIIASLINMYIQDKRYQQIKKELAAKGVDVSQYD